MDRPRPIHHYSFFEFCLILFLQSTSECENVLPLVAKHEAQMCLYGTPFVSWDLPCIQEPWLKYVHGIDLVILADLLKELLIPEDRVYGFETCF